MKRWKREKEKLRWSRAVGKARDRGEAHIAVLLDDQFSRKLKPSTILLTRVATFLVFFTFLILSIFYNTEFWLHVDNSSL